MTFFKKIAAIWNQNPGEWNSFPDFIDIIYSNRVSSETNSDSNLAPSEAAEKRSHSAEDTGPYRKAA